MNKLFFFLFAGTLLFAAPGRAQDENLLPGIWEGKLNLGVELRIVFHITATGTGFSASADSPDQSAFGLKCDTVIAAAGNIQIEMRGLRAVFTGRFTSDSTIEGKFTQGAGYPLLLKKVIKPSERKRPQTPQPPFPYTSEDVEYDNASQSLHYGATLTIPPGTGPFPAAVLITGSGPQDRDENIVGHRLFAVLADALSKNGFVVLRVDDRGVGKSTGVFNDATSADFAEDVNTSLDYLLSRPEVDARKTGLIGHSEGGMIAPMVAAERNDISFMVLLAAPGIKPIELMAEQNAAIIKSTGVSPKAIDAYMPFYQQLMEAIIEADTLRLADRITGIANRWKAATDTALLKELGINTDNDLQHMAGNLTRLFSGKWFRYFLAFDPQPYLQKLSCKVLALNGSRDIQVLPASNLGGIKAAFKKGKVKNYTIKELEGLNHLFQTCQACTMTEYGQLEETFSPAALQVITTWLNKQVK